MYHPSFVVGPLLRRYRSNSSFPCTILLSSQSFELMAVLGESGRTGAASDKSGLGGAEIEKVEKVAK